MPSAIHESSTLCNVGLFASKTNPFWWHFFCIPVTFRLGKSEQGQIGQMCKFCLKKNCWVVDLIPCLFVPLFGQNSPFSLFSDFVRSCCCRFMQLFRFFVRFHLLSIISKSTGNGSKISFFSRNFCMSQKVEKPVLSGQRIKTRKRGEIPLKCVRLHSINLILGF